MVLLLYVVWTGMATHLQADGLWRVQDGFTHVWHLGEDGSEVHLTWAPPPFHVVLESFSLKIARTNANRREGGIPGAVRFSAKGGSPPLLMVLCQGRAAISYVLILIRVGIGKHEACGEPLDGIGRTGRRDGGLEEPVPDTGGMEGWRNQYLIQDGWQG